VETSVKGEGLIILLTIILGDNVQRGVKHKPHFDDSKSIFKQ
jgi:hypothetical protein